MGGVLTPAQQLLRIVPEHGGMAVEAPGDQRAAHGTQSVNDDPGAVERSQKLVYRARVELARTRLLADGQVLEVAPGMAVTTQIKTGHRRVLEYLLLPLQGYAHHSLRER